MEQVYEFSFSQKELWIILKSLGKSGIDDSRDLAFKMSSEYEIQRIALSKNNNSSME